MSGVRLSKPDSFKAHIKFKGSLFNPSYIYLNPAQPLSDPLNTLDRSNGITKDCSVVVWMKHMKKGYLDIILKFQVKGARSHVMKLLNSTITLLVKLACKRFKIDILTVEVIN